jgi:hypothetical protein
MKQKANPMGAGLRYFILDDPVTGPVHPKIAVVVRRARYKRKKFKEKVVLIRTEDYIPMSTPRYFPLFPAPQLFAGKHGRFIMPWAIACPRCGEDAERRRRTTPQRDRYVCGKCDLPMIADSGPFANAAMLYIDLVWSRRMNLELSPEVVEDWWYVVRAMIAEEAATGAGNGVEVTDDQEPWNPVV